MFIVDKQRLISSLTAMQRKSCGYDGFGFIHEDIEKDPPMMCDCKYGYNPNEKMGENTGCPELRSIVMLLDLMTDEEYENIMVERGHNLL